MTLSAAITPARRIAAGVLGVALAGASAGCTPDARPSLGAAEPLRRVPAIADADDLDEARQLVVALDDPDAVIRLTSVGRLRELSGRTYGYDYWRPPERRLAAIERWRAWLEAAEAGRPAPAWPADDARPDEGKGTVPTRPRTL